MHVGDRADADRPTMPVEVWRRGGLRVELAVEDSLGSDGALFKKMRWPN